MGTFEHKYPALVVCSLLFALFYWTSAIDGQAREYIFVDIPDSISQTDFYPFGGYTVHGKKPSVFDELYALSLVLVERRPGATLRIVGALMKTQRSPGTSEFRFSSVSLDKVRFAFTTEIKSGVNYAFVGQFIEKGDFRRFYKSNRRVLRGTLTEYSQGRQKAAADMDFVFVVWQGKRYFERN